MTSACRSGSGFLGTRPAASPAKSGSPKTPMSGLRKETKPRTQLSTPGRCGARALSERERQSSQRARRARSARSLRRRDAPLAPAVGSGAWAAGAQRPSKAPAVHLLLGALLEASNNALPPPLLPFFPFRFATCRHFCSSSSVMPSVTVRHRQYSTCHCKHKAATVARQRSSDP